MSLSKLLKNSSSGKQTMGQWNEIQVGNHKSYNTGLSVASFLHLVAVFIYFTMRFPSYSLSLQF